MDIYFQEASIKDIPTLGKVSAEIWYAYYPGIISRAQIDYMLKSMYSPEVLEAEILQGYKYVLVKIEQIIGGYISYAYESRVNSVKLSKIYLKPELHGKRIGQMMLAYVVQRARSLGAKEIYLFVNKGNTKAIKAYQRCGFKVVESVVTDIGNGFVMDDYRMTLSLAA